MWGTVQRMSGEVTESIELAPSELGESLSAVRLCAPEAQQAMQLSLSRLGQLTPVQAYRMGSVLEIFDGIKRARAARALSWATLRVEVHALDAPGAKVRLLRCNESSGLTELEEAWLVRSLYRNDGVNQPQIAQLLSRHKSWVCRRLALAEELSDELTASVRLGLLSATAARELVRLPRGNQEVAAQVVTQRGLTTRQTAHLVDTLLSAPPAEWPKLLESASPSVPPTTPKVPTPRRTPAEQLVADAWALKRLAVRLQTRLCERSLESLGEPACVSVARELTTLRATLRALDATLNARLGVQEVADAA